MRQIDAGQWPQPLPKKWLRPPSATASGALAASRPQNHFWRKDMHERYLFVRYVMVGVANTLVHAGVFFLGILLLSQSLANLIAFFVSASFSFFANAKFTFKAAPKKSKYLCFVIFMGGLSYLTGYFCDELSIAPAFTFILHCFLSLIIGFLFSKFLFKERGVQ